MKDTVTFIKPCPFCGQQADIHYSAGAKKASITCTNKKCHIRPSTYMHVETDSVKQLVKIWNTRGE